MEADRIAAVLVGRTLEQAWFGQPHLAASAAKLTGSRVTSVTTRGKAMLIGFSGDHILYTHNQLYGRWFVRPRGELPATGRTLRVALHTRDSSALLYSASAIELLTPAALESHPFLSRLGPDALDDAFDWRTLAARLDSTRFSGRTLHSLLLDQHFLAGIGNYLRSEILFTAKLAPQLKPRELSRRQINTLARAALDITRRAYTTRGVTNTASVVRALKRAGKPRRAYRFAVFGRDGLPCHRCETPIERVTLSGRRLYWCPQCQRPASRVQAA